MTVISGTKVFCSECAHFDDHDIQCGHSDNVQDSWRKRNAGILWDCSVKNARNRCELYEPPVSNEAPNDTKPRKKRWYQFWR